MKKKTKLSSNLPEDVIIVILSMVPTKSIVRFRCVCKLWLELFKSPRFIKMHLKHAVETNKYSIFLNTLYKQPASFYRLDFDASSLSYKATKIYLPISSVQYKFSTSRRCFGSCNGILCFSRHSLLKKNLDELVAAFLWNPSTQEYKEIIVKQPYNGGIKVYGFDYDCKTDDYKLILIHNDRREIHVYTLGSNSWRIIRNTPKVYSDMCSRKLLNGAMHWVARKVIVTDNQQEVSKVIVSFDICEERTKEVQLPSRLSDMTYNLCDLSLGVFGKDLYLSVCVSNTFELWVMKDCGVINSWTKLLSISKKMVNWENLLSFNKNQEILFNGYECRANYGSASLALVSYDLRNGRSTFLNTSDTPELRFNAETFIGSLVSLDSTR